MAILPVPRQELEKKLKEDSKAGPRPITIEEYKARKKIIIIEQEQQKTSKSRGGQLRKIKDDIKNYYRLIKIASTAEERLSFKREIGKLRKAERDIIRKKKTEQKNVQKNIDNIFNKYF